MIPTKYLVVIALNLLITCCNTEHDTDRSKATSQIPPLLPLPEEISQVVEASMAQHGLRALSLAVWEDYEIKYLATWGVKDTIDNDPIDDETAFSAASIAKPVTATLFALLEYQGLIDLKKPVKSYLQRWQLPKSKFEGAGAITLEHLLSHSAGTTQHGFWDFYQGDTIPSMIQSLNGEIGDNPKLEFVSVPGTNWRYSGGGYVIAQLAVEDHLGQSLAEVAEAHLFEPLKLRNTTFRQPNEPGFLNNVAKAHDDDGNIIGTGIPITPQIAPSGLWTTAADMAILMIAIQKALQGNPYGVIPPQVALRVTEIITTKVMGGWSIGWERRHGYGNYQWFSHGGANTGIGGHIYGTMEEGKGIAMLGNGPNGVRIPVLDRARDEIIKQLGWYHPLDIAEAIDLPDSLAEQITGTYRHLDFPEEVTVELVNSNQLIINDFVPGKPVSKLIFTGNSTFLVDEYPARIRFKIFQDTMHIERQHFSFAGAPEFTYKKID